MVSRSLWFCLVLSRFFDATEQQNLPQPSVAVAVDLAFGYTNQILIFQTVTIINRVSTTTLGPTQYEVIDLGSPSWVNIVIVYSTPSTSFSVAVSNDPASMTSPNTARLTPCSSTVSPPMSSGGVQVRCSTPGSFTPYQYVVVTFPTDPPVNMDSEVYGYRLDGLPILIQLGAGSGAHNQSWATFKAGYVADDYSFWLGNDALAFLTAGGKCKLQIDLLAPTATAWKNVDYSTFSVGNEATGYLLTASGFSGSPGMKDWMPTHNGMKFTTYDKDNDKNPKGNCAVIDGGGWWYNYCARININNKLGSVENFYYAGLATTSNLILQTRMWMQC